MADTVADPSVTREIPNIVVEVLPGNTAMHDGKLHTEGETFEVEGPSAIALVQGGHVTITGSVVPKGARRSSKSRGRK